MRPDACGICLLKQTASGAQSVTSPSKLEGFREFEADLSALFCNRKLLQKIFNAGKEFKDFQNKLRTDLVENYDAVYVERKNQNCLCLKGFIREISKIQIKKYRLFIRHY